MQLHYATLQTTNERIPCIRRCIMQPIHQRV